MRAYRIIKTPLDTEKTNAQKEGFNQVSFEVDPSANRVEIKRAVEKIFKVNVKSVRTMNRKGKVKRTGRILGKRKDSKKAVVTLAPGQRISFFDGV